MDGYELLIVLGFAVGLRGFLGGEMRAVEVLVSHAICHSSCL